MIVPADQIKELLRDKWTEIVVDANPPAPGTVDWVRHTHRARPEARARVIDAYPITAGGFAVQLALVEPDFTLPKKGTPREGPSLSDQHRRRLFDGNYAPLLFDTEPQLRKGDEYVLSWQREQRVWDGEKVVTIPREALFWIEITNVARRSDATKTWEVRFHVVDRRHPVRLMRRVPILGTPEPEITSDPKAAVDRIERDGPVDYDSTNLLHLEQAREQHRQLHEERDQQQVTRSLTHRLRAARAQARARGIDDSEEVDAISQWIGALERRLGAA